MIRSLSNYYHIFLSCFFILVLPSAADDNYNYNKPVDPIVVDCGSDTVGTQYGLNWESDTTSKSKYLPLPLEQGTSSTTQHPPTSRPTVPYRTARLSRSQFTYAFPVTPGQKFLRLHFFPATYTPDFHKSSASFSLKAGPFTLLNNFSAELRARALVQDGFHMEFCFNVQPNQHLLNLTFVPTPTPGAYAFINGIELLSMPTNLYYTNADDTGLVGIGTNQRVENGTALQLMYRVNVGGGEISPTDDTGMYRRWDSDQDKYFVNAPSSLLANKSIQLNYPDEIHRLAAPDQVYKTARGMSNQTDTNLKYNLTWKFQVDPSFTYFVRLHFCEFQPIINARDNKAFWVYINNQTAGDYVDIIQKAGGNGIPLFKDYMTRIEAGENKNQQFNLFIALHPFEEGSAFVNTILNGVEIYKLSLLDNLAGPNPDLPPPRQPSSSSKSGGNRTKILAAVAGGIISGLFILFLILFFIIRQKRKVKGRNYSSYNGGFEKFSYNNSNSGTSKYSSATLPSDLCRRFSLTEIKSATRDFDKAFIIGVGGFGNVYKGLINDGGAAAMATVAIKRLDPGSQQGANEFRTEIEMLSQLRHIHLVSLIGYCYDEGEMILVYDYMSNGTLQDHLYKTQNPPIPWKQRLEICTCAARGLHYLHSGASNSIIHRDVKSTNILLDDKWVAKVSDFGLSKIGPGAPDEHVSTVVKGSFGYLDPEYYRLQRLTEKSDVYSFGVVLWEVLSARPSINRTGDNKKAVSLAEQAKQCHRSGRVKEMVDPNLDGEIAEECLKKFAEVAMSCLREKGIDRPSMGDVVWGLEFAMELQENGGEGIKLLEKVASKNDEYPLISSNSGGSDLFSINSEMVLGWRMNGIISTSTSNTSTSTEESSSLMQSMAVFTEILEPKGR
ncbi:Receptor-like protein kinase FERONIA [Linum perenne]